MKIVFFLTYYHPHWTGLTQYATRLAEGCATRGHTVTVVTSRHEEGLAPEERIRGVTVKRLPVWFRLSRTLVSPKLLVSTWKEIAHVDRVVVYLPYAEVLYVAWIARLLGKRLWLVHNGDLLLPSGIRKKALEAFYMMMTGIACRLASGICIQTQDYARSSPLLTRYFRKSHVVLPLFPRATHAKITRSIQHRIPKGTAPVIGFAGRFVEEKGFDILLRAIPLVIARHPRAVFVYAGELRMVYESFFENHRDLWTSVAPHVVSLGRLTSHDMDGFYRSCDLVVVPSRSDCFPSVLIEALLSRVPVVVTDIPGARWAVRETGMGRIVEKENPTVLAKGIEYVCSHRRTLVSYYPRVATLFDYEKTLATYERLICG